MASPEKSDLSTAHLAELSALADGTLDPALRPGVQARIATSPELRELYERELRVVERLHRARAHDRAPLRLRTRIDEQRPAGDAAHRGRAGYRLLAVGALAAVVLVLALAVPSGTPGSPTISQAAALAARGATGGAPALDPTSPGALLDVKVQNITFPNWSNTFGWRAVGQRSDHLDDRTITTVYYRWHGVDAAYSIVTSPVLRQIRGHGTDHGGYELHTLRLNGRLVVTWRRDGHTCVLSAVGVPAADLQKLAASNSPAT